MPPSTARRRIALALFVCATYGVVAVAFLSPLASSELVPGEYDYLVHINAITQASQALQEGQFPIRVAPGWNLGYRYPLFQFYSPSPYTLAGFIHRHIGPENAFFAYRFLLLMSLVVGGAFTCAVSYHLVGLLRPAYLSGVIYMTAPYFTVNIHARSAWTEAIAQGVLPAVLFFTIKAHSTKRVLYVLAASLSWYVLCTTHMITFVYAVIFIMLLVLGISMPLKGNVVRVLAAAAPVAIGCGLAWYYLWPAITTPLRIGSFANPYSTNWLTPLFTLLSPVSIAPEPQPGRLSQNSPGLHTSVGWVILVGVGYVAYAAGRTDQSHRINRKHPIALLAIFGIAFCMTWSPLDFWQYLPSTLFVTQFTYRLMAHVTWSGALLCAYALALLSDQRKMCDVAVLTGILVIVASHASWLNIANLPPRTVNSIATEQIHQPAFIYAGDSSREARIPTMTVDEAQRQCVQQGTVTSCNLRAVKEGRTVVQLPAFYYPDLLSIEANGREIEYFPMALKEPDYVLTGVEIGAGDSVVAIRFRGSVFANRVSVAAWIAVMGVAALMIGRRVRTTL